jgi:hypothetical protein
MPSDIIDPLDIPVHGAREIARVLNLRKKAKGKKKQGEPDERRAYYLLEGGFIDADRMGKRKWWSTPRRLLFPRGKP